MKFGLDADCGDSLVHRCDSGEVLAKSSLPKSNLCCSCSRCHIIVFCCSHVPFIKYPGHYVSLILLPDIHQLARIFYRRFGYSRCILIDLGPLFVCGGRHQKGGFYPRLYRLFHWILFLNCGSQAQSV